MILANIIFNKEKRNLHYVHIYRLFIKNPKTILRLWQSSVLHSEKSCHPSGGHFSNLSYKILITVPNHALKASAPLHFVEYFGCHRRWRISIDYPTFTFILTHYLLSHKIKIELRSIIVFFYKITNTVIHMAVKSVLRSTWNDISPQVIDYVTMSQVPDVTIFLGRWRLQTWVLTDILEQCDVIKTYFVVILSLR